MAAMAARHADQPIVFVKMMRRIAGRGGQSEILPSPPPEYSRGLGHRPHANHSSLRWRPPGHARLLPLHRVGETPQRGTADVTCADK